MPHDSVQVLVVDDQEQFRAVLRELVDGTDGMAVAGEASTGEEALEAAGRLLPQLVLMDVRMPGIGGIEATRRLVDAHPRIVVVLVSIDGTDPELVRASGAAAYVPKEKLTRRALADAWQQHGPGG